MDPKFSFYGKVKVVVVAVLLLLFEIADIVVVAELRGKAIMTNMLIATARSILKEVRFIAKETRINNVVSFPKIFRNLFKARRLVRQRIQ